MAASRSKERAPGRADSRQPDAEADTAMPWLIAEARRCVPLSKTFSYAAILYSAFRPYLAHHLLLNSFVTLDAIKSLTS